MNLFAYGTLMSDNIMFAVTGKKFLSRHGIIHGFGRYYIKDEIYPGLIPENSAKTSGLVYMDVDHATFSILDDFEGDYYQRDSIQVMTSDSNDLMAQVYLIRSEYYHLVTRNPWSPEAFETSDEQRFLSSYKGFESIKRSD